MNFLKKFFSICTMVGLCSLPAWAQVAVNYPANGAVVAPQFSLSASDGTCSGQPVSAMGFSLDSSSNNTFVYSTSIYSAVTATAGAHTLHVKAWGNAGSACDTDVAITVDGVSVSSPAQRRAHFFDFHPRRELRHMFIAARHGDGVFVRLRRHLLCDTQTQ